MALLRVAGSVRRRGSHSREAVDGARHRPMTDGTPVTNGRDAIANLIVVLASR
jgi:hypothetical protein